MSHITDSRVSIFGIPTKTEGHTPAAPAKPQLITRNRLLLEDASENVIKKLLDIATNDEHAGQMTAIKLVIERMLPMSEFDKDKNSGGIKTVIIDRSCGGKVIIKTGNGSIEMDSNEYDETLTIEGENNG